MKAAARCELRIEESRWIEQAAVDARGQRYGEETEMRLENVMSSTPRNPCGRRASVHRGAERNLDVRLEGVIHLRLRLLLLGALLIRLRLSQVVEQVAILVKQLLDRTWDGGDVGRHTLNLSLDQFQQLAIVPKSISSLAHNLRGMRHSRAGQHTHPE